MSAWEWPGALIAARPGAPSPRHGIHDRAGVRSGMVFIRNQNGSHNADEGMTSADFDAACQLLTHFVASFQPSIPAGNA